MFKMTVRIGDTTLEYQHADIKAIHRFSALYGALPTTCNVCQCGEVFLFHKAPKGNDYYSIKCRKCGAELNFHKKKTGGFYVVAGEKMTVYRKNAESDSASTTPTAQHVADNEGADHAQAQKDEDIPF